jgi:lysozyme
VIGTKTRISLAALSLSAAAFVGLLDREGYSDQAIIPTKGDVPTIGFGTTDGVQMGDKITPPQAVKRAIRDVVKFEGIIKQCVHVPLAQHEYDAYVDLAYNIGPTAFCGSTLVKKLNESDYRGACRQILEWRRYQGIDCAQPNKVCGGLWIRRKELFSQCLGDEA